MSEMSTPDARISPENRRPVSVLVVVYVPDGDVLLLRRARPFDFWQSVTGSLQDDETHAEAAARELQEETGLTAEGQLCFDGVSRTFVIDPRWRNRYAAGVTDNVEYEWRYRLPERREIILDRTEHSESQWMAVDEAIDAVWSWTNREALIALRNRL